MRFAPARQRPNIAPNPIRAVPSAAIHARNGCPELMLLLAVFYPSAWRNFNPTGTNNVGKQQVSP